MFLILETAEGLVEEEEEEEGDRPEVDDEKITALLTEPFRGGGYHLSMDNYFTSLELVQRLMERDFSVLGTIRHNRREIPAAAKQKLPLHETLAFKPENSDLTLTQYQCKRNKFVLLLSSLHRDVVISEENNPKRKPDTVLQYNKEKVGVDILDCMLRRYSTKSASCRWPIVFYNIIDMCVINSWIVYRETISSNISRRIFMELLVEEMTGEIPNRPARPRQEHGQISSDVEPFPERRQCGATCNKNRTKDRCGSCLQAVCGKCSVRFCKKCI